MDEAEVQEANHPYCGPNRRELRDHTWQKAGHSKVFPFGGSGLGRVGLRTLKHYEEFFEHSSLPIPSFLNYIVPASLRWTGKI